MINLEKFCRLCLTEDGVSTQLFDDSDENYDHPMCEKVMRCFSVKIQCGDGLPTMLCQSCVKMVNNFWCFKALTEHVDTSLRKLLENAKINWGERIKAITQEAQALCLQKQRISKQNSSALQVSPTVIDGANSLTSPIVVKEETDYNQENEDENVWPESPASPSSLEPTSLSPLLNHEGNDHSHKNSQTDDNTKRKVRRKTEYICEFCGRKFPRSNHLAQHELTHVAEKPFHCSDCDKSFWYKQSLIGHIKQTHTGDVNYTCDLCGKGFFKKTEMTRHKATHSKETPHKCSECGMGFKISKTLKRHMSTVHAAHRSHTCETCGKSFAQYQTLKVHMILHTGEKPYVCSYCGKGFAQSAPLKTHIRLHTGERPYVCHVCGDSFINRTALTCHSFKHDDVLPYACTRCSATFRLKRELTRHEQGHLDLESHLSRFPIIKDELEGSSENQSQLDQQQQQISDERQQQHLQSSELTEDQVTSLPQQPRIPFQPTTNRVTNQ